MNAAKVCRELTGPELEKRILDAEERATQGEWGQFHPRFSQAAAHVVIKAGTWPFDSSHDSSAVCNGVRQKLAHWQHADDAAFAELLVNAWREGRLVVAELPAAPVAVET